LFLYTKLTFFAYRTLSYWYETENVEILPAAKFQRVFRQSPKLYAYIMSDYIFSEIHWFSIRSNKRSRWFVYRKRVFNHIILRSYWWRRNSALSL